jgi:diguanylate cyclase (GGDEF)-like protein
MLENELRNEKRHFMMSMMDIVLLCCHTMLFIFFICMQIKIMVYVNIFSIVFYGVLFILLKLNIIHTSLTTWLYTAEILIHLTLALFCLGWSCGFQLYCIGLLSILFFSSYGSDKNDAYVFHPVQASIISMLVFFGMEYYTSENKPVYAVSFFMQKILYTVNALFIFLLVILFSKEYSDQIRSTEQKYRREADLDELTRLYNRRRMREIIGNLHAEAVITHTHYCVAMFDIDDFKKVNDTYGHAAGDYVLSTIGKILLANCSDTANVCRWGGEEFLFIEPYTTDNFECMERIEAIRKSTEVYQFIYDSKSFNITVTAGVANCSGDTAITKVIAKADENLYLGKNTGKNKVIS